MSSTARHSNTRGIVLSCCSRLGSRTWSNQAHRHRLSSRRYASCSETSTCRAISGAHRARIKCTRPKIYIRPLHLRDRHPEILGSQLNAGCAACPMPCLIERGHRDSLDGCYDSGYVRIIIPNTRNPTTIHATKTSTLRNIVLQIPAIRLTLGSFRSRYSRLTTNRTTRAPFEMVLFVKSEGSPKARYVEACCCRSFDKRTLIDAK
jgi:hypothetical protein